jgi:hypothetical protein
MDHVPGMQRGTYRGKRLGILAELDDRRGRLHQSLALEFLNFILRVDDAPLRAC